MEKSLVYGGICGELLANFDHESSSWRMLQTSFDLAEPMSLGVLPKSGMTVNGQLYPLNNLALPTCERDGFVLPTPTARMIGIEPKYPSAWRREEVMNMGSVIGVKVCQHYGITKVQAIGEGLVVNPPFVEWMMGFPQGWTDPNITKSDNND